MSEEITSDLSADERAALLDADLYTDGSTTEVSKDATADAPAVATETTQEVVTDPPVATEPVTPEVKTEKEDEASGRFRLSGKPAAFAQLIKEGIPEAEAVQRVYGAATQAAEATTTQEEEETGTVDPLAEQRAELADITTQLDAAADDESLFTPELRKLQAREAELKLEIKLGEKDIKNQEVAQEQSADAAFDAEYDRQEAQALAEYPDAGNLETPLGKLVNKLAKAAVHDPDSPKGDPTVIAKVIAEAADALGIKPVSAQQGGSQQSQETTTPAAKTPGMVPISGAERTTPSVAPNKAMETAAKAERLAKASSPAEKQAILDEELYGDGFSTVTGFRMA